MYVLRRHVTETAGVICTTYGTEQLNHMGDFRESWYEHCAIRDHPTFIFCNFMSLMIPTWPHAKRWKQQHHTFFVVRDIQCFKGISYVEYKTAIFSSSCLFSIWFDLKTYEPYEILCRGRS
jgi:hypothetical protein